MLNASGVQDLAIARGLLHSFQDLGKSLCSFRVITPARLGAKGAITYWRYLGTTEMQLSLSPHC